MTQTIDEKVGASYLVYRNEGSSTDEQWNLVGRYDTMKAAKARRQRLISNQGWCDQDFRIDAEYRQPALTQGIKE